LNKTTFDQTDAAALRLMQQQTMRVGQQSVYLRLRMAELEEANCACEV
jgi:hypothetical protein